MMNSCPHCGDRLTYPVGLSNSKILLIGDYPDWRAVMDGVCISEDVKLVLQTELAKVGLQFNSCRYTNIWQHGKKEKGCDPSWHIDVALKEIKGKTHVLAMGSDVCHALFGKGAMEISGLKMQSEQFPKVIFYACPNPSSLFQGNLGEFRLALSRFKDTIRSK